ncbi:MAG TPA: ubiquitin carboxyl-terminal hydrolase family protein [Allocoleopsis sp.]
MKASGLRNLGKTCYINSVVQAICSISPFTQRLIKDRKLLRKAKDNSLVLSFMILMSCLIDSKDTLIEPLTFTSEISKKFEKNKPHDSHEFLTFLLEALHICFSEKKVEIVNNFASKHSRNAKIEWNGSFQGKSSVITELFYGQYISKVTCRTCDFDTFNYQPFNALILQCPKKKCNISSLLKSHFLQDFVYKTCDTCSKYNNTEHSITSNIFKLPGILIIVLNRFEKNSKNIVDIELEETIDLSDHVMTNTDECVIYSIKSVICHYGNGISDGHYICYTKINNSSEHYLFNDTEVVKIENMIDSIDSKTSYIVIYESKQLKKY